MTKNATLLRLLYQRGESRRYYADLRRYGGGREALRPPGSNLATTDSEIALQLLAARVRELDELRRDAALYGVRRVLTLGRAAAEWLEGLRAVKSARESTIRRYTLALDHMFAVVEPSRRVDALTISDARRAVRELGAMQSRYGRPLSGTSVHHALAAIQQVHDYAISEGAVRSGVNPWRCLKKNERPRVQHRETDFLEIDEAARLISACGAIETRTLPLRTLVMTYLHTGGRRTEVLGLTVGDIDFVRGRVRFGDNEYRLLKRGKARYVPLFPALAAELKRYLAESARAGGLLFPSRGTDGAEQMYTGKVYKHLADAAIRAGIDGKRVTPQVFRVTYCAARLQSLHRGHPCAEYTVQAEMGHANLDMIQTVYGRLGHIQWRVEGVEYVDCA